MEHFLKLLSFAEDWEALPKSSFCTTSCYNFATRMLSASQKRAFIMAKTSFGWLAHIVNKSILCNVVCSIACVANCHTFLFTFLLKGY